MRSNENYHHQHHNGIVASRRRLPFDSSSARVSSPSMALKRSVSNTYRYPSANHRHEIFLNKSSSSSITEDEDDEEVKMLDETLPDNGLTESDKRKNSIANNRHTSMNNQNNKRDYGNTMIQELLQSNMNLKKEIRDIRRQLKHNNGTNKQRIDRSITTTNNNLNKNKVLEDDDCSFAPPERDYYNDPSISMSKLQQYKTEAITYKQQLDTCQETIAHLRKTINSMEKRMEHLRTNEHRQHQNGSSNQYESIPNNTDHRFIHELFHLCIKHTPRSSKLKTTVPSHHDMKTFVRQTFTDLIKTSSSSSSSKNSAYRNFDSSHFVCKCSDRSHPEHRPSYQYCLSIIEQCQSLFDVTCFTQLSTALNELYYRHGELMNFKRSIASTLGITESSRLISCPKLIKTLQQTLDDARSNELVTFKKMAKINDMNEAVSKIRSYDDFVPYYHQFIEQMANLLEVSKGDEIMPAIKTLQLLAHGDSYRASNTTQSSHSLTRASSLNTKKNSFEKNLTHSKSLRILSSKINDEQLNDNKLENSQKQDYYDDKQQHNSTDDGES